jgi:uracil-DNA glycosylase family 4
LGKTNLEPNRHKFEEYAKASLPWLHREIEICNPYVIILLGQEVAKAFFGASNAIALTYLDGAIRKKEINGIERNIICLPHPGILMKKTKANLWPDRFEKEISVATKRGIEQVKKKD